MKNNKINIKDLSGLKDIYLEDINGIGRLDVSDTSWMDGRTEGNLIMIKQTVYEDENYNKMTDKELDALFLTLDENEGITINSKYNSHLTLEVGNDSFLHLISIEVFQKGKGFGNRVLEFLEYYSKENNYEGLLIRSTESVEMNTLCVRRGYVPIYSTIEERIEFGKKHGFRYRQHELEYDKNGNLFGYWVKRVNTVIN